MELSEAQIGGYQVIRKLGEGGMAETWLCHQEGAQGFQRKVVIKTPRSPEPDESDAARIADEARIGSLLEHPNIPRVTDLSVENSRPFLVQEFVDGPNLTQVVRRMRARSIHSPRFAAQVCADIARTLHFAHCATGGGGQPLDVIHRDVSMSNILVSASGVPKLIDFGVASWSERKAQPLSDTGSLSYLAPELLVGGPPTHRTDLYALGVVLYVLASGQSPWHEDLSILDRASGAYTPITEHVPDLPQPLVDIIDRLLSLDPKLRYHTGEALGEALSAWLSADYSAPRGARLLSETLQALFPEGAEGWKLALPATTGPQTPAAPPAQPVQAAAPQPQALPEPPPVQPRSASKAPYIGLGLAVLLGLGLFAWSRPAPEPVAAVAPAPVAEVAPDPAETLLDEAEAALQAGDLAGVSTRLSVLETLSIEDADALLRRGNLERELAVAAGQVSIRRQLKTDPAEALTAAFSLDQAHPAHPDVAALIDEIETAVAAKEEAAAQRATPRRPVTPIAEPLDGPPLKTVRVETPRPAPVEPAPAPAVEAAPAPQTTADPGAAE